MSLQQKFSTFKWEEWKKYSPHPINTTVFNYGLCFQLTNCTLNCQVWFCVEVICHYKKSFKQQQKSHFQDKIRKDFICGFNLVMGTLQCIFTGKLPLSSRWVFIIFWLVCFMLIEFCPINVEYATVTPSCSPEDTIQLIGFSFYRILKC